MALQNATTQATPTAQVVGNAFVEQYYHILHRSPELVYKFYQDSSMVSRPDPHGAMTSVTTMQGINEKILSLNYTDFKAEIITADAQKSYMEGVSVLVTGCLTGKDNLRRKFVQSFFLAPQDSGFFVLNDVFRYIEDSKLLETQPVHTDNVPKLPTTHDPEPASVPDPPAPDPASSIVDEDENIAEKAYDPSEHEIQVATEDKAVVDSQPDSNGNDVSDVVQSSSAQEDAPKKSYASIVKVAKDGLGTRKIYVPTNIAKVAPKKTENQSVRPVAPGPEIEPSTPINPDNPDAESSDAHEEVEDHSIYIRNLPLNMTVAQLEIEFKKFGPIKDGGVQVRHNKPEGYCFGFVEFHSFSSMNNAIQASPINIDGCQAFVEKKKARNQGGGGRGRFPLGRGGFRNDSFWARGNYGPGRSFRRNESGNRNEFSGRGRGLGGRGEGYPGRGRGGRSSAPKQNAAISP